MVCTRHSGCVCYSGQQETSDPPTLSHRLKNLKVPDAGLTTTRWLLLIATFGFKNNPILKSEAACPGDNFAIGVTRQVSNGLMLRPGGSADNLAISLMREFRTAWLDQAVLLARERFFKDGWSAIYICIPLIPSNDDLCLHDHCSENLSSRATKHCLVTTHYRLKWRPRGLLHFANLATHGSTTSVLWWHLILPISFKILTGSKEVTMRPSMVTSEGGGHPQCTSEWHRLFW